MQCLKKTSSSWKIEMGSQNNKLHVDQKTLPETNIGGGLLVLGSHRGA